MSRKGWMRWKLKIYDMEVHSDRSIQVRRFRREDDQYALAFFFNIQLSSPPLTKAN